jgi:hypothetical protein
MEDIRRENLVVPRGRDGHLPDVPVALLDIARRAASPDGRGLLYNVLAAVLPEHARLVRAIDTAEDDTHTRTETAAGAIVVETVTRLILHCSRCGTQYHDDDYSTVALWTWAEIEETFPDDPGQWDDAQGWARVGDRILCTDCWTWDDEGTRVEVPAQKEEN